MQLTWSAWVAFTLIVGAGFATLYAWLERRRLRAHAERPKAEEGHDIAALATAFEALEEQLAGPDSCAESDGSAGIAAALTASAAGQQEDPLQPEMLAAVTAAATAFLGKTARDRSSSSAQPAPQTISPWSQQGRVMVESSHNLRAGEPRRP